MIGDAAGYAFGPGETPWLDFKLIGDDGVVYVDCRIDAIAELERAGPLGEEHARVAVDLAEAGIGSRMVITDPDGVLPPQVFVIEARGR